MAIKVQAVHFDADKDLVKFVEDKVEKLNQFFDGIVGSEVFLKIDKSSTHENKVAEIKILIPGKELFAKKQSKSFEEATDEAVEALRRQITKHKGKLK